LLNEPVPLSCVVNDLVKLQFQETSIRLDQNTADGELHAQGSSRLPFLHAAKLRPQKKKVVGIRSLHLLLNG
jgi:hypothetical protein